MTNELTKQLDTLADNLLYEQNAKLLVQCQMLSNRNLHLETELDKWKTRDAVRLWKENEELKQALDLAVKTIEKIDLTLQIPAAEYVPSIADVFTLIDEYKKQLNNGQTSEGNI